MNQPSMKQELLQGAAQLGLSLTDAKADALLVYLDLIQKWNKVYNLTAVRDPADMLTHHLLDSLAVVAPLRVRLAEVKPQDARLLDVGSGAGLPGVVLVSSSWPAPPTVASPAAIITRGAE